MAAVPPKKDQGIYAFDAASAARVAKAVRTVESMGVDPNGVRVRQSFSIVQVVVPRDVADVDGFYPGELYDYDAETDTYELVDDDILIMPLPDAL